jgi:alpha-D-xyloside xylohydrolase
MIRRRLAGLVMIVASGAHCAGGEVDLARSSTTSTGGASGSGPTTSAVVGDEHYSVKIATVPPSLTLERSGTTLLSFPADALQIGTVTAPSDSFNYDPYFMAIGQHAKDPEGLAFVSPTSAKIVSTSPVTVALSYPDGAAATLTVQAKAEGRFEVTLVPDAPNAVYFRLRPRVDTTEGLYGLGEQFDQPNNRGFVRPMQLETGAALESGYTPTHAPIPFVTGTRGWGLYVASPFPGVFDAAAAAPDVVEATFAHGLRAHEGLTFHLFAADHPLDVAKRYYDVTGYPRLPARWALGPWLWRNGNVTGDKMKADLETMRALDLPHGGVWFDNPFKSGVESFAFDPKMIPDPVSVIDEAHALGFRFAVWSVPYLDPKSAAVKPLLDEAKQKGLFPPVNVGFSEWGPPIDFTNPSAVSWWQDHLKSYTSIGIEGFKLDYGEEVVPGFAGARTAWSFADRSDERTMHARYGTLYHQTYQGVLPPEGSFLLCRHGNPGDQVNVSVMWPGDLDASWARTGDKTVDANGKPYTAVGGFPASVVAGLSLSTSGFPFYGADTGGYIHSPADKELFARWFEQTALSTVMQIGNEASVTAWETTAGYDAELLSWYRTYTRLHLRLFPYEWSHAMRIAKDGRSIVRPLGLAYPELGVHPADTYLFGDDLLVAPVVDAGKTSREVHFPPGDWVDWWTGERHAGPAIATVAAPIDRLPLFVRAGSIVPLLRPTIDTLSPTTATGDDTLGGPLVDSYATTPGVLYPRIVAGDASTFALFDGGTIAQRTTTTGVELATTSGSELAFGARIEVIAFGPKPSAVALDGAPLTEIATETSLDAATSGWVFDATLGGRLLVKVAAGSHTAVATR